MKIDLIQKENIKPVQWGGGETFQLFIYPENKTYAQQDFDFRISAASIHKSPSVFTKFDGYRRYLIMLDNDLKIVRNAKEEHYKKWEIFEFDSSDHIKSFSTGHDFNLMISKNIPGVHVTVSDLRQTTNQKFAFVFSFAQTDVYCNNKKYKMEFCDLLMIQNREEKEIMLSRNQEIITGCWN